MIKALGSHFPQDDAGRVLNRCEARYLEGPWKPLVEASVAFWLRHARPLAIYVRGSVPAGTALEGLSDLDTYAWFAPEPGRPEMRWEDPEWAAAASSELVARYPLASRVEFKAATWVEAWPEGNVQLKRITKTQSLLLWGEDLGRYIPAEQVGPGWIRHLPWLEADWEAVKKASWEDWKESWTGFLKTLVRGCFELVMLREGRYALDFYPCLQSLARWYPAWAGRLERLAMRYGSGFDAQKELVELAGPLVAWALKMHRSGSI